MKMLAMDTSTWSLALAVMDEDRVLGEFNTTLAKNHSLRLMPAIDSLLAQLDLKPSDLKRVAVAQGPGSYTGVRIGLTTAKSLAWALAIPIAAVSSLQVVAQNGVGFPGQIIPLFDARRGQVYTGVYATDQEGGIAYPVEADRLQLLDELLASLTAKEGHYLFLGEGVTKHEEQIRESLGSRAVFGDALAHQPRGAKLGYLAWKTWTEHVQETHSLAPEYLQLAEAERKWLDKSAKGS